MEFSAQQIAALLGGTVEGNPNVTVNTLSKIEEGKTGSISFLANPQYTPFIYDTDASVVIVSQTFLPEKALKNTCTLVRVENPYESFAVLLNAYDSFKRNKKGIEQPCFIAEGVELPDDVYVGAFVYVGKNVKLGKNVKIYPNSFIGEGSVIGDNTTIFAGVRIYHESIIGNNCTIHSGVVIGGDGFGFAPNSENNYQKVAQIGNVIIEDNVEVGSNTTIDRATMGSTIIKKGVKLDNLIQIAHNVEIGENTVIASQTGVAGSTKIGKNCMIGGQVGIIGHIKIGDNVKIAAQSGIGGNIEENDILQGSPAMNHGSFKKSFIVFRKLPELLRRIEFLENLFKKEQTK